MKDLVRLIIRIGLRGPEKLHGIRPLDKPAILYPTDVVVVLREGVRDPDFLQGRRIIPPRLPWHIHQTVTRQHLAVESPIVIMLRLCRVVVRAPQVYEITAAIRLHPNARIEGLPGGGLGLASPRQPLQGNLKTGLAPRPKAPIIPVHVPEQTVELMPVQLRLQIQLVKLEPGLLVKARVESENGQLLPNLEILVPIVHKKHIPILSRRAQLHACPQILSIQNPKQLLKNHGRQKLRLRLLAIYRNHAYRGLRAEGARLPGLQIRLDGLRRLSRVLIALAQIETGDIDFLIPAANLYPALQGGDRIRPVP